MTTNNSSIIQLSAADRVPQQNAVETVLRRTLKISNPRNLEELSKGLLRRYSNDAMLMDRERKGLPYTIYADTNLALDRNTNKRPEVIDAQNDLERVLGEIASDPALAEISGEMRGWAKAIRSATAEGLNSAPFALDQLASDRALSARRALGDFARISRYTAAMSSCDGQVFCRLAQVCDAVASLILVLMGDAMAEAGVTRSTHVPRIPVSSLRQRRDNIMNELQLLLRSGVDLASPDIWPRGTASLMQIDEQLTTSEAADLRSLLDENYLSRQLDELIDLASDASIDGMKALGSVAMMSVRRFRRFIAIATSEIAPSPPLTRFVVALALFIQGFAESAGGYRLAMLARSPLLAGQATLTGGADAPTYTLIAMALARSAAAEWIDCLCCSCSDDDVESIMFFAKSIYDLDRAIDLYALGIETDGQGDAEIRAGAYAALLEAMAPAMAKQRFYDAVDNILVNSGAFAKWRGFLGGGLDQAEIMRRANLMGNLLCQQLSEEKSSARLVSTITPICRRDILERVFRNPNAKDSGLATIITNARNLIQGVANDVLNASATPPKDAFELRACALADIIMPADMETSLDGLLNRRQGFRITLNDSI